MDNFKTEKPQDDSGYWPEVGNKRKRRCSLTQPDESPKKKSAIDPTVVSEENHAGAAEGVQMQNNTVATINLDEKDIMSQILLEELCDEVLYEIFKFLDTWSLMALMKLVLKYICISSSL